MEKKMKKAYCFIAIAALCISGCSAIELRSPIVIHSGQKPAGEAPAAQVQAEPATSPEAKDESTSPSSIKVLTAQDLNRGRYSSLGHITVASPDKKGFSTEQADRQLKIAAYKRYGALAQGIAGIEYRENSGLFSAGQNIYREASAEVMTMATAAEAAAAEQVSAGGGGTIPSLDKIVVVSSDELFNRNFKVLGKVIVRDKTPEGMTEEQAVKNLKIEAYRLFGSRVKGLSSLKLKKEDPIYFYKKPMYSPPPQVAKGYNKATAEVLYWP
jgi:hypothetical protein